MPAVKAIHLARHVAGKIAKLGQQGVQLVGPADKTVSRVAIGTGAITPFRFMVKELKADINDPDSGEEYHNIFKPCIIEPEDLAVKW